MRVPDGRRDGADEEASALFSEEGVELDVENDIDHSEIPLHLRPLVSAAESGDLNALRLALGNFHFLLQFLSPNPCAFHFYFSLLDCWLEIIGDLNIVVLYFCNVYTRITN